MECQESETYIPAFDNPYPETPWSEITGFAYGTPLHLCRCIEAVQGREGEDGDYIVSKPYTVRFKLGDDHREITVPQGMVTDLASVPWAARFIIGRVGPHLEASILHDFLYIAWQDLGQRGARDADRKFADELMRVAMGEAKVSAFRRCLIYVVVRAFGGCAYRRQGPKRYVRDRSGEDT